MRFFKKKKNVLSLESMRTDIKKDAGIFTSASMIFNMYSGYEGLSYFFPKLSYDVFPIINFLFDKDFSQSFYLNAIGLAVGVSLGYGTDKVKSKGARNIAYNKAIGNKKGVINWRIITYSLIGLSIFCLVFVGMQKASTAINYNKLEIEKLETKLQLHDQAVNILNPLDKTVSDIQAAIGVANANIQKLINEGATKKEIKSAGYQLTDSKTGLNLMLSNAQKALSDNQRFQVNRLSDDMAKSLKAKIDTLKNTSPVSGFTLFQFFISWYVFSLFIGGVIIEYLIFATEQTISFNDKNNIYIDNKIKDITPKIEGEKNQFALGNFTSSSALTSNISYSSAHVVPQKIESVPKEGDSSCLVPTGLVGITQQNIVGAGDSRGDTQGSTQNGKISASHREIQIDILTGKTPCIFSEIAKKYVIRRGLVGSSILYPLVELGLVKKENGKYKLNEVMRLENACNALPKREDNDNHNVVSLFS